MLRHDKGSWFAQLAPGCLWHRARDQGRKQIGYLKVRRDIVHRRLAVQDDGPRALHAYAPAVCVALLCTLRCIILAGQLGKEAHPTTGPCGNRRTTAG